MKKFLLLSSFGFLLLRPVGSGRFPGTGRSRGEVFRLPAL